MGKRKAFESFEWKAGGMILRIVEKRKQEFALFVGLLLEN